jgi:hypothetical protein
MRLFHFHRLKPWCSAVTMLLLVVFAGGCKEELKGGPRVDVVPVTGKLLVDGQPQEGIWVFFTRTSDRGVDFAVPNPEGITDKDGVISATTYLIADGCPPGDYTLTFQAATLNPLTGSSGGDKFKGKFMNKEKSEHKVTIPKSDEPFDLGTIEISTK